jgi:hypothetical protein
MRKRLLSLIAIAVENFNAGDWLALATHTGCMDIVRGHDRLLRSLSFGDPDYSGCAHEVMLKIVEREHANFEMIESFIGSQYGGVGQSVSTAPSKSRAITFAPSVFEVPETGVEADLVAAMMPFSPEFEPVFQAINLASTTTGLRCLRAKDIWVHETVIQDIFGLIFRSQIVVCDFSGKNPNVFYEAGIAHTLGKTVIPITQADTDIPFDLRHHRYLRYLNNDEGRTVLRAELGRRMVSLRS